MIQYKNIGDRKTYRRSPNKVMKLSRMGAYHQTRLSFMRSLLRKLKQEHWLFQRLEWNFDKHGVGYGVYEAKGPRRSYCLVAFGHDLADEKRSDRVIATAWDATFCLFDGVPTSQDIARLKNNVPKQEAGRISKSELSLSRANRSTRLWKYVVNKLADGQQPDVNEVEKIGYLMRTTAVYGSGKFGAADRSDIESRKILSGPFHIEMLSVFLTRSFSMDLVEYMAKVKGGKKACIIEPNLRRKFGIGNSTGLGMAPFLINHPILLHNWVEAKEEALARVRAQKKAEKDKQKIFFDCLTKAICHTKCWFSNNEIQAPKIIDLNADLERLVKYLKCFDFKQNYPWNILYLWAESTLSLEAQELLVSLVIEPYGNLVDDLTNKMSANEYSAHRINGEMGIGQLKTIIENHYAWAIKLDYVKQKNSKYYWYISEEKLEPRIGNRYEGGDISYEQPLCIGKDVKYLSKRLKNWDDNKICADLLLEQPEHRHIIRRIQQTDKHNYAEIRDNLIGENLFPVDLLRCKLSFFGATHFDPRSDKWVRICMFKNAPFPQELCERSADDWIF